jgi:hypothetical protein
MTAATSRGNDQKLHILWIKRVIGVIHRHRAFGFEVTFAELRFWFWISKTTNFGARPRQEFRRMLANTLRRASRILQWEARARGIVSWNIYVKRRANRRPAGQNPDFKIHHTSSQLIKGTVGPRATCTHPGRLGVSQGLMGGSPIRAYLRLLFAARHLEP